MEEDFLAAARYSEKDFPKEAALAYLCASRSAYVRGKGELVLGYAKRALELDSNLHKARFQRAKLSCHLGNWQDAEADFKDLFHNSALWAVKAADDGDVRRYEKELNNSISFVTRANNERINQARPPLIQALEGFDRAARKLRVLKIHKNESVDVMLAEVEWERASGTLSGAHHANKLLTEAKKKYQEWVVETVDNLLDHRVKELGALAIKTCEEIEGRAEVLQQNRARYIEELPGRYKKRFVIVSLTICLIIGAILFIHEIIQLLPVWSFIISFFGVLLLALLAVCRPLAGKIIGWIRTLSELKQHDKAREQEEKLIEEDAEALRHLRSKAGGW